MKRTNRAIKVLIIGIALMRQLYASPHIAGHRHATSLLPYGQQMSIDRVMLLLADTETLMLARVDKLGEFNQCEEQSGLPDRETKRTFERGSSMDSALCCRIQPSGPTQDRHPMC